ncbi:MAG: ChbG/HpnK family deacetylase [Candidatus Moraniibacteriota bacterium]
MHKESDKIIISADDFGISRLASENIMQLVNRGKVDRVEVMMSKNISSSQVEALLASNVKIDIHLHLVKDKLDYWQEHARKIEDGAVVRGVKFILKYVFGITSVKNIEKEWQRQIEEFVKIFGKAPDGASSHEHIHFFPPYLSCLLRLCKKFGINYVRFGKMSSMDYSSISKILNWLRKRSLKNLTRTSLYSTDYLISYDWTNDLNLILKQYSKDRSKEIVFHLEKANEFDVLADFEK